MSKKKPKNKNNNKQKNSIQTSPEPMSDELKDLYAKKAMLDSDISNLEKQIKANQGETQFRETQIKQTTKEKPAGDKSPLSLVLGGGRKKTSSGDTSQKLYIPELARLPETGELYQKNGQDFLAIRYWEEYNDGKKEASRLNAKLCAKEES